MFKKSKASPATQSVSVAGSRASEKKEKNVKKRNKSSHINGRKIWYGFGYVATVGFILVSVFQSTGAFSNVNTASIIYKNELVKMQEEKEKAQQAVADELDVNIDKDNSITPNDDDTGTYYMDDDCNVIRIDEKGDATVYYICTKCDKCGNVTADNTVCSKCGSNLCKYVVYQVKAGDTLSEVSGKVGASVNSIAHLNELDDVNLIYTGESLRIPE